MRKPQRLLALLMCLVLLLGLFGCNTVAPTESVPTTPATTDAPPEPSASERYCQAAQPLRNAQDLAINLTTKKTITAGTETFEQKSKQSLILTGIGTDDFTASMVEDLTNDDLYNQFTEYYNAGTIYVNIYNAGYFQSEMSEAEYLARFAPAALLDETLYTSISAEQTSAGTTLTFADPSDPESWALPEGAQFSSAGGTAKISSTGELTSTTYTIEYTHGNATVSMEVSAQAEIYKNTALEAPSTIDNYKKVDSIDALRLYELATLYMYCTDTASSTIQQTIVCQAAGYMQSEDIQMHYSGLGAQHMSQVQYTITSSNGTSTTEIHKQTERFQNGTYTYAIDDGKAAANTQVTWKMMYDYLQDQYSGNLPALSYITNVTAEQLGSLIYVEMELNEQWGQDTADDTVALLFEDPDFLNNFASAYRTTASGYYMVLDAATGLPVSAGTNFAGVHTIDGSDYVLRLDSAQTYRIANPDTHEALVGETAPENPATPLFYRVTGEAGQTMYLLGTIHVGDARTAFLPDEIYDALNKSDALAVEADVIQHEKDMDTNPELAAQLAAIYINPDGTATKDQLDEDVYAQAIKLLKASGNYNSNVEYMRPYLWSSSIENFYITLGPLSADKGVDHRLLELAKAQNKQILEVESYLEQLKIFTNFSPALQSMLLEGSLSYTAAEYCANVQSLYEQWCAGDEATLRATMQDETTDMTNEELAIYQEYLDAMIIQRNKNMLTVAISYLESGDTVFYAVGLAHLLQENGLVDTLRDAGYTVELVTYQ